MDKKDRKIISYLFQDSRMPASTIGKHVELSKESVRKRINNLKEKKYIQFFRTNINLHHFNLKKFDIYIRLSAQSAQKTTLTKLNNIKNVNWIGTCFGTYDIRCSAIAPNIEYLTKQLGRIKQEAKEIIICQVETQIKIDYHKLNAEIFEVKTKRIKKIQEKIKAHNTDTLDKNIINTILCNARMPLVNIANKYKKDSKVIQYRIKKLKKANIIKSYTPDINGAEFGYIWGVILVKLNSFPDEKIKQKLNIFAAQHKISTCSFLLGSWDLSINLFAKDIAELSTIMNSFKEAFAQDIIEYNPLIIFEKFPKKYELPLDS